MARKSSALEGHIAQQLGVTTTGLRVLARMVAGGGVGQTAGMSGVKLLAQGYIRETDGTVRREITDAGREIVRRARAMGW